MPAPEHISASQLLGSTSFIVHYHALLTEAKAQIQADHTSKILMDDENRQLCEQLHKKTNDKEGQLSHVSSARILTYPETLVWQQILEDKVKYAALYTEYMVTTTQMQACFVAKRKADEQRVHEEQQQRRKAAKEKEREEEHQRKELEKGTERQKKEMEKAAERLERDKGREAEQEWKELERTAKQQEKQAQRALEKAHKEADKEAKHIKILTDKLKKVALAAKKQALSQKKALLNCIDRSTTIPEADKENTHPDPSIPFPNDPPISEFNASTSATKTPPSPS